MLSHAASLLVLFVAALPLCSSSAGAQGAPPGFQETHVLFAGQSPASLKFAPDGRLFFGRRVTGELCVANAVGGAWQVAPGPFYIFDVPQDGAGSPLAHRSSGLRDFAFDPDFETNGFVYAFFMKHDPRHNRVVRIQADPINPGVALAGSEVLLLDLPFTGSSSSGSHNGGGLEFGLDGKLYITTGDGWTGGDPVQSLSTWTGKVLRLERDGSIPSDNPFYSVAIGDFRAIYCLGARNPFSLSVHPVDGSLFANETLGSNKTEIFRLSPGANFGHQGYAGLGIDTDPWSNAYTGRKLNTGGAWYAGLPDGASAFPAEYQGSYFVAQWGSNSGQPGSIVRVPTLDGGPSVPFADPISSQGPNGEALKPVCTRVGPDGHLYYLLTTYQTEQGEVRRIEWGGVSGTPSPSIAPFGGQFDDPVQITLGTSVAGATIHYTLDGLSPSTTSPIYTAPITLFNNSVVRAIAHDSSTGPSGVTTASFTIGAPANLPPVAIAGPDQRVPWDQLVTLNGSASYDPDGNDLLLSDTWVQTGGPPIADFDGADFVSFFTPTQIGDYSFRLDVGDGLDTTSAELTVRVVPCVLDVRDDLVAHWSLQADQDPWALDHSTGSLVGTVEGGSWAPVGLDFDGVDDSVQLPEGLDPSGNELTVAAWIRPDDFDVADARILSKATGTSNAEHELMLSTIASGATYRLRFRLKTSTGTTTLIASSGDLVAGQWRHVAARYDGVELQVFLDGALVGSIPQQGALVPNPLTRTAIGAQPAGASGGPRHFDGRIADVRVYSRALDSDELGLLSSGLAGTVPLVCQCAEDLGFGGPGQSALSLCGPPLIAGNRVDLRLTDGAPGQQAWLGVGSSIATPMDLFGGTLLPVPLSLVIPIVLDTDGAFQLDDAIPGGWGPLTLFVQAVHVDPTLPQGFGFSNCVRLEGL